MSHDFERGDIVKFRRNVSDSWGVVRDRGYPHGPCVNWWIPGDCWFQQDGCLADDVRRLARDEEPPDDVYLYSVKMQLGMFT